MTKRPARKVLLAASLIPHDCLRGISRFALEHDWHLVTDMLFTGSLPRGWNGDGVLAMLPYQPELLGHLQGSGLPCVVCTNPEQATNLPCVEPDDAEIGRLAADHLLERAHRSFAWSPLLNDHSNRARHAAFLARLNERHFGCRSLPPVHTRIGRYWQNSGTEHHRSLVSELQRLPRPTAIFAYNDCVAAHLIDACGDAGLSVPEDIAILGVGNSLIAESSPVPLSSVDDNMEDVGFRAAALLHARMCGAGSTPATTRVTPRGIITRLSTDPVAVRDPRVARALCFIAEHYPNPMLTVRDIAEAVGMSRRCLERGFRDATGCTINEHIVRIRMREASRLLKTHPRAKSSDIAALVGISGSGTFFRTFRRYFGMNPRSHRDWGLSIPEAEKVPSLPVTSNPSPPSPAASLGEPARPPAA